MLEISNFKRWGWRIDSTYSSFASWCDDQGYRLKFIRNTSDKWDVDIDIYADYDKYVHEERIVLYCNQKSIIHNIKSVWINDFELWIARPKYKEFIKFVTASVLDGNFIRRLDEVIGGANYRIYYVGPARMISFRNIEYETLYRLSF